MLFLSSLKRALTVNFLLVASVPVLLFGILNIQLLSKHQLEGVRERNMMQAVSIAAEVESFLLEVRSDLLHVEQTIASEVVLKPTGMERFLTGVVQNSLFFESIYLLDKDLQVLHLGVLPKLQSRRDDYAMLDFSGHQLLQNIDEIKGPVWSNTFVSLITGEPSVTLGMPTSEGFLLGNIHLSSLGELLQRYSAYSGVEVSIIDNSGTLIAHNIPEMAMQRVNFGDHPAFLLATEGVDSTREFRQGAKYVLESATRIPASDWVVWVGLDMHQVLAPIHDMRNLLIATMAIAMIVACVIALLNVRRLMQPLTALGLRAAEIADGHYEFQFRPSGFSEIDALANQITSMTHAIKVREESIVSNEQRFRDLVNSIDGIVWEMEYPSFRFLFVSRQAETMLGFPVQDWYEDRSFWVKNTHVEDVKQSESYCKLMTEKQQDHDFEFRMIAADGRIVWIRNLVTVVVEENRPVRLLGVMIDVTVQKELLEELSRSEENYREIFNAASDAIFIHDAETGQILDVNRSMLNLYSSTYEEALTCGLESFIQGDSPYSLKEAKLKLQEAQELGDCTFEWRSRKMTGELFWSEVYLRSAIIGGQPRIIAAVRDISARKVAEEKLREANERLVLLIDRMPLGCVFWKPDFTVDMWNPAAESIFGFSEQEMLGKGPYGTIVSAEAQPIVENVLTKLRKGDLSAHSMNENITKSGKAIICEWYNTPVSNASGTVIGTISMVQDVTERKIAEDELSKYRADLEALVKERTVQLEAAQEELIQKGRLAVLGQLTATVSHEIRNPLGTVANAVYLLKEALSGEEHAHLARPLMLAERNVERCDGIISDLLDFSRQRKIEKEPLDIDTWFAELLDELSVPDDVLCHRDFTSQATVMADSERLRRVMVNVITNALQALEELPDADKTLEIQTRVLDDRCEISVRDSGAGMSEEVMARIFEPMFSTKNFGVGLGVPIIKNILDGHNGGVDYLSEVGKGTTVAMWLPLANKSTT